MAPARGPPGPDAAAGGRGRRRGRRRLARRPGLAGALRAPPRHPRRLVHLAGGRPALRPRTARRPLLGVGAARRGAHHRGRALGPPLRLHVSSGLKSGVQVTAPAPRQSPAPARSCGSSKCSGSASPPRRGGGEGSGAFIPGPQQGAGHGCPVRSPAVSRYGLRSPQDYSRTGPRRSVEESQGWGLPGTGPPRTLYSGAEPPRARSAQTPSSSRAPPALRRQSSHGNVRAVTCSVRKSGDSSTAMAANMMPGLMRQRSYQRSTRSIPASMLHRQSCRRSPQNPGA